MLAFHTIIYVNLPYKSMCQPSMMDFLFNRQTGKNWRKTVPDEGTRKQQQQKKSKYRDRPIVCFYCKFLYHSKYPQNHEKSFTMLFYSSHKQLQQTTSQTSPTSSSHKQLEYTDLSRLRIKKKVALFLPNFIGISHHFEQIQIRKAG